MGRLYFYMDIEDKDYPFLNKSVTRLVAKNAAGEDVYLEVDANDQLKVTSVASGNSEVILNGTNDSGTVTRVPVTAEGHIEVAIHGPRLPFGSIHTERIHPIFQADGVYGINAGLLNSGSSLSGSASVVDSSFVVSLGTTSLAQAFIQSRKRLRYRAGQGIIGRFAGLFTSPVPLSYQIAGFGHAEDGVYFGYKEVLGATPSFGILYVSRGVREVQTLTVTTGATSASNCTITLNNVAFTVALSAASNIQRTVYEISRATYAGWEAFPSGATVVFLAADAGNKASTFSFGAGTTGAAASFAETKAGVAATEIFIPQSTWNGDVLDGSGSEDNPSGILLDPTKGNVYQVGLQYLGFGTLSFSIEVVTDDGNNADFVNVHTIKLPNTLLKTSFSNPSFPFTMAVYSATSTTDLSVKVGSFAGFIEGEKVLHGNRFSFFNSSTAVTASDFRALFTIQNKRVYSLRANQSVVNLISVSGAVEHNSPAVYYLFKNATLNGNPNFQDYATTSCTSWDTAATTCTISSNDQLLWTGHVGSVGEVDHHFEIGLEELTMQPGETFTLACRSLGSGSPSFVTGAINTREDQ